MKLDDLKHALDTGEGTHLQLKKLVEEISTDPCCCPPDSDGKGCGECAVCIALQAFEESEDAKQS